VGPSLEQLDELETAAGTGVALASSVPLFFPQQYAAPELVKPHVLDSPAVSDLRGMVVVTRPGLALVPPVVPSWPDDPSPQHQVVVSTSMVQVCPRPVTSSVKRKSFRIAVGLLRDSSVPSPIWPAALRPQQYANPSVVSPHVWLPPEATFDHLCPPMTGTGVERETRVPSPS